MKYRPINGYTKAKIIKTIQTRMKDRPSRSALGGGCVYLSADGNRCAVGAFIPDGHPGEKYPDYVVGLLARYPDLTLAMPLVEPALMAMQAVHDESAWCDTSDRRPALIKWVEENVEDSPEAQ